MGENCVKQKTMFPLDVISIIAGYVAEWKFAPWIEALHLPYLQQYLHQNPMAQDMLKEIDENYLNDVCMNCGEWAVDWLINNQEKIKDWYFVAKNANPRAFHLWKEQQFDNREIFDGEMNEALSTNPSAIDFLSNHPRLIARDYIVKNPLGLKLIQKYNFSFFAIAMVSNPADWAVDYLLQNPREWESNTKYASSNTNPRMVQYIIQHNLVNRKLLSQNPSAIAYLKKHPEMVHSSIYANPSALELTLSKPLIEILSQL